MSDYDSLVKNVAKQVYVRYDDYIRRRGYNGWDIRPLDEVVDGLLIDELNNCFLNDDTLWTIMRATCDDCSVLFHHKEAASFKGFEDPYEAFGADCKRAALNLH